MPKNVADLIDLGVASVETRGSAPLGIQDTENDLNFVPGPIQLDD